MGYNEMAIRSFSISATKALRSAAWQDLPNVAVIAGPNGVGKSTLLSTLWNRRNDFAEPGTHVTYLGPHRPWRRSTLGGAAMYAMPYTFRQSLEMPSLPGFQYFVPQGLQFAQGQPRLPDSADEVFSFVKYSIIRMAFRHLRLLNDVFMREGSQIPAGVVPDLFGPLREITRFLLPYLEFDRVDLSKEQDMKCLFRRVDADNVDTIDIDDLSSGEKAVISLFLPFLESQMEALVAPSTASTSPLATALIDEPELHLHPTLQISLIDYMRTLADRGEAQFIVATHSVSILDGLREDEFFLLVPAAIAGDGNQFTQITRSEERLESIRQLTGSTYLVTRCRPVVFIEGERGPATAVSDQRLVETIVPEAAGWVVVPAHGRRQVISASAELRDAVREGLPGIPVFALVDADQVLTSDPDYVIRWPVAMLENLLLDVDAIWLLLEPYRDRVGLNSAEGIRSALKDITTHMRRDEIRLRASPAPVRIDLDFIDSDSVDAVLTATKARAIAEIDAFEPNSLHAAIETAAGEVDAIIASDSELERFRGKQILKTFYENHAKKAGFNYQVFVYELARSARALARLQRLVNESVRKIEWYIPPELVPTLQRSHERLIERSEASIVQAAIDLGRDARRAWESNHPDGTNRNRLRELVFQSARAVRAVGDAELHGQLLGAAVQIGVPSEQPPLAAP